MKELQMIHVYTMAGSTRKPPKPKKPKPTKSTGDQK